ncbi:EAL domain-containing protein [Methylomagnum ishizawai]|uniref:EAL domain-containing protein n=1 Tax=Methylomagnum ishizawai TaxID=1760988 RepID=UPI001C326E4D|nr:EAL domain-containing protein [Methylomagnum ishizawai]BBL74929.1 GGDEF domain-containing protein [Methylomagnum ishizawai]
MTLSRQMVFIILVSFVFIFMGTFAISLENARHYLARQLESHAQDTATSLGLSLSPVLARKDTTTLRSMVDAIFDRGYYRELVIAGADGTRLLERVNPAGIAGVPAWFVELIPLETPPGEALLVDGWMELGTLRITSHPGFAYAELWRTSADTLLWLSACTAAALGLGLGLIHMVLKRLRSVETQAEAICDGRYPIQDDIPKTRELRHMVLAMNRMSARVQQAFAEQSAIADTLRAQVYVDEVTGLGNRRYFDVQLGQLIQYPDEFAGGALLLMELADFKDFNNRHGYVSGDELLRKAAASIRTACPEEAGCLLARLAGGSFGVIATHGLKETVETLAQRLAGSLVQLRDQGGLDGQGLGHIGVALYATGQTASELLGHADHALRTAQAQGACAWHIHSPAQPQDTPSGARNWRKFLEDSVREERIELSFQPVLPLTATPGEAMHREVLLRLRGESGEMLTAGTFLPMAERVGLAPEFDRIAVRAVLERMGRTASPAKSYAVNLTPGSLRDAGFVDWLCQQLKAFPERAKRLTFEVPEYGVVGDVEAAKRFVQRLRPFGSRFSIDHFGRNFASFAYLHSIGAAYIKIDGSFVRNLHLDQDNQFFLRELTRTAHEIDMKVIAMSVETAEEREALAAILVDGIQGYLICKPGEAD